MEHLPSLLRTITNDPALERDFLDFLSQLEYVGCRKILKGVPFHAVTLDVLRHVAEEASHAYILKAAAERLGGPAKASVSWADSQLGQAGWEYFRRLDERVSTETDLASLNYPAVSWAVERRVLEVYPLYLEVTGDDGVKSALRRILAQEKRHGRDFEAAPFSVELKQKMIAIEEELWRELETSLQQIIENGNRHATTFDLGRETSGLPLQ